MTDIQILYEGPIVKRAEAKELGLTKYFTGKPCRNCHIDQRWLGSRACVECKRSKASQKWSSDKSASRRIRRSAYLKYRDRELEYAKLYRKENPDLVKKRANKWRDENKGYISEYNSLYRLSNSDIIRERDRNRRSLVANADGSHSRSDISLILIRQKNKCAEPTCGKDLSLGYHVDHIMPLKLGGSNWPENLQCLCPTCNLSKGAKHPIEWAKINGRLL